MLANAAARCALAGGAVTGYLPIHAGRMGLAYTALGPPASAPMHRSNGSSRCRPAARRGDAGPAAAISCHQ